jgi:hypothetical protein
MGSEHDVRERPWAANLALLGLDIVWDRQGNARSAESGANELLEARPSTG